MSLLKKEIKKINFIVNQYSDDKDLVYELNTKTITGNLKKIIDKLAPKFGLISENSVRTIMHYSFSPRVKDAESLKEKLVRNNLLNEFEDLIPDNFEENDELARVIKDKLLSCDDLIGIKILTDLNMDCKKMLALINSSEFKSSAKALNIILNDKDLKKQPQPMRNGLDIFKIRGTYEKYNFELQIKSKIISAWGDMEHSIFYKDYAISPVRDTAQKSMNHVGKLLFQIDDFVESIRDANKDYAKNAQALLFLSWFETNYSLKIKSELDNVSFRYDGISELLFTTYKFLDVKNDVLSRSLHTDHYEFQIINPELKKYTQIRNKNYDLKVLESIILSWIYNDTQTITTENIEEVLKRYFSVLVDGASTFFHEKFQNYEIDELKELISLLFSNGLKYDCKNGFFLNINKIGEYLAGSRIIDDMAEAKIDSSYVNSIKQIVFVKWNDGKYKDIISELFTSDEGKDEFKKSIVILNEELSRIDKKEVVKIRKILTDLI